MHDRFGRAIQAFTDPDGMVSYVVGTDPKTAFTLTHPAPNDQAALDTALGTAATALGVTIGAQLIANGNDAAMFGWLTGSP